MPVDEIVRLLSESGCDAIEIGGQPSREDIDQLLDALRETGLKVSGITPLCRWPTEERDLAHPDPAARERAVDYYTGCIDLASMVGAPSVGLITVGVGRVAPEADPAGEWREAVIGARQIAEHAADRGIELGIEAVNRYESYMIRTAEQAMAFAEEVGPDNVGVILDLFHMGIEEPRPAEAVSAAADRLVALHIAGPTRAAPDPQAPADRIDEPIAAAVRGGFDGPFVIECTAAGYDPFNADKGPEAMEELRNSMETAVESVRGSIARA
ncbi:MAG: sugar phosphate isomerase/epimerase family protein [Ilumatobacteraceae bacterium]